MEAVFTGKIAIFCCALRETLNTVTTCFGGVKFVKALVGVIDADCQSVLFSCALWTIC